ncbi:DUF2020 domain-containing protein [Lentzea sp. BCCO 10_0856]|uniref:DUF2020 domain-containing protein n=1 Tax=Lentzea miocenica TaxID=3095431 RepID=A0ABU4T1S7_9PSEU|nr:DUF2020 domain-containing protein [Lentzea sp. BCCO 10_0856]MDX8032111.1 DUF2020 domain-containing protein [Lentzea sp. BCCO 10_0856]
MKRALLLPLLGVLAACGTPVAQDVPVPTTQPQRVTTTTSAAPTVPPAPQPVNDGACPYLATGFVAEANGQRVPKVKLSTDEPHPACFFYATATEIQLTVRVYVGDERVAKSIVNEAAPDGSQPASSPTGWAGGYVSNDSGVVYAVSKGTAAVVVTTNQKQSIKARRIAEEAVKGLKI